MEIYTDFSFLFYHQEICTSALNGIVCASDTEKGSI